MKKKFLQTISEYEMLSPGDSVLVGVSGGADSMCLLSLLTECAEELGISVAAAHVNHCIRGEEADRDESFVESFCAERKIPFYKLKTDIPALARISGESTELCARNERYAFFESLGFSKTATAHTGSDRVETMLMNLARGSALNGLSSIPPVRGNIIRPLIGFLRSDTEQYCAEHGIAYVTDSTNLSDEYTRNRYRHKVVPAIAEINPAFEKNALRCMDELLSDARFIDGEAKKLFSECYSDGKLYVKTLSEAPHSIKSRVIARFLSHATASDFENRHIKFAEDSLTDGFSLTLPSGVILCGNGSFLFIKDKKVHTSEVTEQISFNADTPSEFIFGGFSVRTFIEENKNKCGKYDIAVDFSKIDDIILIRSRCAGDRISLPGRNCTKSLKKLFNEYGIPCEQRDTIPVFADSRGIIGIGGISADASRISKTDCKKYLIIKTEVLKNAQ